MMTWRALPALMLLGLLGSPIARAAPVLAVEPGAEETVFAWDKRRCEAEDIPDLPARAFIEASGRLQLIASHEAGTGGPRVGDTRPPHRRGRGMIRS